MTSPILAVLSVILMLCALVIRPTQAQCPRGMWLEGVRPDGAFDCRPNVLGNPEHDGTFHQPDDGVLPPGQLQGRIYCTGGTRPIVRPVDSRTVGCQR